MLRLTPVVLLVTACNTTGAAPPLDAPTPDVARDVARDVERDAPDAAAPTEPDRDIAMFHGNRARHGWYAHEPSLTPARVRAGFGPVWTSAPFESVTLGGRSYAPHVYATPLYLDRVAVTAGEHRGRTVRAVFAATSNADVYALAVAAIDDGPAIAAGTVLWRTRVTTPGLAALDGSLPMGVLSTPVIDTRATPPTLYVASMDASAGWQVIALDATSGARVRPAALTLDQRSLDPVNGNGPAVFAAPQNASQRGALALSRDGGTLYVPFGTYAYAAPGWMVAIDTRAWRVARAFSSAPSREPTSVGGMWASGGPAIDDEDRVYMTTGNDARGQMTAPGVWGSSLLRWRRDLTLDGTYSPFNYCVLDAQNMDLGGCGPMVLPAVGGRTPELVAFGGKQGVMYLLDRARMPGSLTARASCRTDAASDASLLNPTLQPQWNSRGPLLVFPPYTERYGQVDHARMRTTPALWQSAQNETFLFVSGSSRAREEDTAPIPPALARLRVVTSADAPAHLAIDAREMRTTLMNPGSPVVSSDERRDPVVWVLDANVPRSAALVGDNVGRPMLYAFDGSTMELLWQTPAGALEVGGKYSSPSVARGQVFIGTDRVRALGSRERASVATPCRAGVLFGDDFDGDPEGAPLARGWQLSPAPARAALRVSRDDEGAGDRSARYVILTNNGADGRVELSAATPPFDASACANVTVELSVIAFSMENGEMDAAWIEARGNGWDWITLEQVFPSRYFAENISCRAGQQATGCTRWTPLRYELPRALIGDGLQVRLRARMLTSASDAMGIDRVSIIGR